MNPFDFKASFKPNNSLHIFVGTDFHRDNGVAFQTTKYSIESQTDFPVSIIPINTNHIALIPSFCLAKGFKGKALYIPEGYVFKCSLQKLMDEATLDKVIWCAYVGPLDEQLHMDFIVFNLNFKQLYMWYDFRRARTWSPKHIYKFRNIATKQGYVEESVGKLDPMWNVYVGKYDSGIDYKAIKGLNFSFAKPWTNSKYKFARDWWNEFNLFVNNVLLKDLKTKIASL